MEGIGGILMADAREELNRLAIQAQLLQREGQALEGQIDIMRTTISDMNATIDTLNNLEMAKNEGLLPVGSGAYITCKQVDADSVLISVGAGLIVRKKAKEAVEILDGRLKSVSGAFEKAQKNLLSINQHLQDVNAKANALVASVEDVRPA